MKSLLLLGMIALAAQSDEEKAIQACTSFLKALQNSEHEKAADLLHPKSLVKMRSRILNIFEKAPASMRDRLVKTLEFADWSALEKAAPRDFIVAYLKNAKNLGESARQVMGAVEGMDAKVIGAVRREDKFYVIFETTFKLEDESHVAPLLLVAYLDGDSWKLAFRSETNIGK